MADSELHFLLKALIKHKFNKIIIEDAKKEMVWIKFVNDKGRSFNFTFTKKEIKDFK